MLASNCSNSAKPNICIIGSLAGTFDNRTAFRNGHDISESAGARNERVQLRDCRDDRRVYHVFRCVRTELEEFARGYSGVWYVILFLCRTAGYGWLF